MKGNELDFSIHLNTIRYLLPKLRGLESTCGGALIHDTRMYISILSNWESNLEYWSDKDIPFTLIDWNRRNEYDPYYEPTQEQIDKYFGDICDKAENWLIQCAKK